MKSKTLITDREGIFSLMDLFNGEFLSIRIDKDGKPGYFRVMLTEAQAASMNYDCDANA